MQLLAVRVEEEQRAFGAAILELPDAGAQHKLADSEAATQLLLNLPGVLCGVDDKPQAVSEQVLQLDAQRLASARDLHTEVH